MNQALLVRTLGSANNKRILKSQLSSSVANQKRALSTYVLDGWNRGDGGGSSQWDVAKTNTIFNIVPQGHKYVVERFGKLHSIQDSSWFLAIPLVGQISYVIDIRERTLDIPPQAAITRDNVSVEVAENMFVKVQDA
jgi:hypothetical protein